MSHYCCKRCGQRYEHCVCPDVQPTSPIAMNEEKTLDEHAPFWDDDLACHQTLALVQTERNGPDVSDWAHPSTAVYEDINYWSSKE